MTLAGLTRSAPIPDDPQRGRDAAAAVPGAAGRFHDLLVGAAGCAPHLASLMSREGGWLAGAAQGHPDAALEAVLDDIRAASLDDLAPVLRVAKRRVGLLTALADLGGVWDLDAVTGALSALADTALGACTAALVAEAQRDGRLPTVDATDGGLFVLAMGKLGAVELNYSSDIDLIVLFDESLYPAEDYPDVRKQFIRITQRLVKLIGEETGDGYVFRTDLRLRPDPSVTPVCIGMGAAERYYEAQGRTWERAAFIRARVCAGDTRAGTEFLESLTPFMWRRHLDYAAIQDAHEMRLRIRDHKKLGGRFQLPGHDVKLGRGGIREIEFFVQTNQLICGGRDPSLRLSRTRPALDALAEAGWIPRPLAEELKDAYVAHRTLEHRLQMLEDAQTHIFPASEAARDRLAHFCGAEDRARFEEAEAARFDRVHKLVEEFFAPSAAEAEPEAIWAAFPDPEAAQEATAEWPALPALRSQRARRLFRRLLPKVAERLSNAADPNKALSSFDRFLRGLPAGVQVFSLFEANPHILDLLVDICATAPRLADYLGRNARVLDAVLAPGFFEPLADVAGLEAELSGQLSDGAEYEDVLNTARIWCHEQVFRVGVQLLRRIASAEEGGAAYSAVAETVLRALLPHVIAEHARRHGPPPGGGVAVLAMGKLGSGEMTAGSDLDLIIVYDAPVDAQSEGPKPLAAPAYYARFTQALVAALSAPTAEGALYDVDMRLRPSGRQGPVATSLSGFIAYHHERAWTWEHLAMTRARVVAGPEALSEKLNAALAEILAEPRDPGKVLADACEMRARILAAKGDAAADPWEMKEGPGRMLDIELLLQTGKLLTPGVRSVAPRRMIPELVANGWLEAADGEILDSALARLKALQQLGRLALDGRFDPARGGPGLARLAAEVTDTPDVETLKARLASEAEDSAAVIARILHVEPAG